MWPALAVAAVALAGVAFMLRFLIAMLRESAPSLSYWIVPVRHGVDREVLEPLSSDYVRDNWPLGLGLTSLPQGRFPSTKLGGIPVRPLRQTGFPDGQILVRMKIGPWQS